MIEFLKRIFGYRRMGAIDEPSNKDYKVSVIKKTESEYFHLGEILENGINTTDLLNFPTLDQKRTNRCTAYALAAVITMMVTRRLKKKIYINPEQLWNNQLRHSASESKGDSLQNAVDCVLAYGVKFNDYDEFGRKVERTISFKGYARLRTEQEAIEWMENGHPIFTGVRVFSPFVDMLFNWLPSGSKLQRGHALAICGFFEKVWRFINSWGKRWGIFGQGNIKRADIDKTFSQYILYGMEIV